MLPKFHIAEPEKSAKEDLEVLFSRKRSTELYQSIDHPMDNLSTKLSIKLFLARGFQILALISTQL